VRGIVFGHLSLDRSEEDEFEDFVLDLVSDLGVPVIMDFPAGHDNPNLTLPSAPRSNSLPRKRRAGSCIARTRCSHPALSSRRGSVSIPITTI
jgi:hypothetical protein